MNEEKGTKRKLVQPVLTISVNNSFSHGFPLSLFMPNYDDDVTL